MSESKTKTETEKMHLLWLEQWSDSKWIREMAKEAREMHEYQESA